MLKEITPYRKLGVGSSCFDDCYLSVFHSWDKEYEFFLAESCNFSYKASDSPYFGNRIVSNRKYNFDALHLYHGIKNTYIQEKDCNKAADILIHAVTSGSPVCINIDDYWLPWSPNYQTKFGPNHFCLVTGYIPEENAFKCIDPIYVSTINILPIELFVQGFQGRLNTIENTAPSRSCDYPTAFNQIVESVRRHNHLQDMKLMAEHVLTDLDFGQEKQGTPYFYEVPLFRSFENVAFGRKTLHDSIVLLSKYYPTYKPLTEKTLELMNYWSFIKGLVAKEFLKNNESSWLSLPSILHKRLQAVIELEENLMSLLHDYTLHPELNLVAKQTVTTSSHEQNYTNVDLSSYFNHKIIGDKDELILASAKDYIVSNGKFNYEVWVFQEHYHFIMQNNINEKDNISCSGQRIEVIPEHYDRIMIVGLAESSHVMNKMTFIYDDGTLDSPFNISDWTSAQPSFNEEILWEGLSNAGQSVSLFVQTLQLDKKRTLQGLILPDHPDIHIFSTILCV